MQQNLKTFQLPRLIWQFRKHLGIAFGILLLVAVAGGMITEYAYTSLVTINDRRVAIYRETLGLSTSMMNQQKSLRGYVLTANPLFLDSFFQEWSAYRVTLLPLEGLLREEAFLKGQQQLTQIKRDAQIWYTSFALVQIHLVESHHIPLPQQEYPSAKVTDPFPHLNQEILRLQSLLDHHLLARRAQVVQFAQVSLTSSIALMILLILLFWWTFRRSMFDLSRQLAVLRTTALRLTQGNFHERVSSLHYEELEQVGRAFNHMVDVLQQQQETVSKKEHQLRLLIEATPQIVQILTSQGFIEFCNKRWFDYSGLAFAHWQEWIEIIHPDDQERYLEFWRKSTATGEPFEIEYRLKRAADGTYRWHLARAVRMKYQEDQIFKWFFTATDIDDLKRTEIVLSEINQGQRNFVSTASHEFRTALTTIQGFSEILCDEAIGLTEVREYARDINEEALRLRRIIDEMLDLGKMSEGKMTLHKELVDINALLQEIVARVQLVSHRHTLSCQLDENIPSIEVDRDKLLQVVANLLSNAIKYAPNGGEILVSCRKEEDTVHVSVQDHGIGIPAEALQQVFLPYHRMDEKETRYIQGTGLGLPIVRHIITMHGGNVWVESIVHHGSVFHFTLPLQRRPEHDRSIQENHSPLLLLTDPQS